MFYIKTNLVLKTENQQNMQYLAYLQTKQSIEKKEKTSCIFLDFAKAFHCQSCNTSIETRALWYKRTTQH